MPARTRHPKPIRHPEEGSRHEAHREAATVEPAEESNQHASAAHRGKSLGYNEMAERIRSGQDHGSTYYR